MKKFTLFKYATICAVLLLQITPNTSSAKWKKLTDISSFAKGRWGAQIFTVDNKIYVGGGYADNLNLNDLVVYDPSTSAWTNKKSMPGSIANRSGGISFTVNGKAYIGLGIENFNQFTSPWSYPKDLWEYDHTNDKWTQKASFPGAGKGFAGVFVINKKVYVVGGQAGKFSGDGVNEVYEYDPSKDKWTKKANFPETLIISPMAFSLANKGYIVGGVVGLNNNSNKTYEYNPTTDKWTEKTSYPEPEVNGGVAFIANGAAYCGLGRTTTGNYSNQFWSYNAATDKWSYAGGFELSSSGRMYGVAAVQNNKAYIGAGWKYDNGQQTYYRDWYEITPSSAVNISTLEESNKDVIIFPNPAQNKINIKNIDAHSKYSISNSLGQTVSVGNINNNSISIKHLQPGLYFINIESKTQLIRKSFAVH